MQLKISIAGAVLAALVSTAAGQSCPQDNGATYIDGRGDTYEIACNTSFSGRIDALNIEPNTFSACIDFCSAYTASPGNLECVGVDISAPIGAIIKLVRVNFNDDNQLFIHSLKHDIIKLVRVNFNDDNQLFIHSLKHDVYSNRNTHSLHYCVSEADGSTQNVYFGDVAPGTYCDAAENRIRADNEGNCSPDGSLQCGSDGSTFMVCDQGGLINFGSVAPGTKCENGAIVAA
ncbi:hypothetical protein G7Y79_00074g098510 [Physcia stellaris]|nr:hypothetical protein G7Y79_00074g098510 [Physcia stellaris]